MNLFQRQIFEALEAALCTELPEHLDLPPDTKMGHFALPCFQAAKKAQKNPGVIAQETATRVSTTLPSHIQAKPIGPYVNFFINEKTYAQELLNFSSALRPDSVLPPQKSPTHVFKPLKWIFEFSSPNVAKPFMIYHFRGTGLGACLYRVAKARGHHAIAINHLGDWGTQFGKLFIANSLLRDGSLEDLTFPVLVQIYVDLHKRIETEPELEDQSRAAFKRLEAGDPTVKKFWEKCIEVSLYEFNKIYLKLNVSFDYIWGESHYENLLVPLIERLRSQNILELSDGAWIAKVEDAQGKELTPCILQKSDGSSIYATRDVAAAIYRQEKLGFDRMTYIVGGEQRLHFQQIFGVIRKMGLDWISRCEHVPTGLYRFKDAKMSTRKGNFVTFEDVYQLAKDKVREKMDLRQTQSAAETRIEYTKDEYEETIDKVALGAIVFHDLHADPARDVEFDVERVTDFEGETGPYLQYARTRCTSILRKAKSQRLEPATASEVLPSHLAEMDLIVTLSRMEAALDRVLDTRKATGLAQFLIEVTKKFSVFYRECSVLNATDEKTKKSRLALVQATQQVLTYGLGLIGIPCPEKM